MKLKKSGVSGEIQGLDDLEERLQILSRTQMIEIIMSYYKSNLAITDLFTFPIGMEAIGDRKQITDEMVKSLLLSENTMWNEIMSATIDRLKKQQNS